jgi:hypothetical protein
VTNVEVAPKKAAESQRKSSETPTGVVSGPTTYITQSIDNLPKPRIPSSFSRVAKKAPKPGETSDTLPSVSIQLERSLIVLNGLLLDATDEEDVHRIGMVAESMSKVLLAMKAASVT